MKSEFSAQTLAAIFLFLMLFFSLVLVAFYSIGIKPYKFKSKPYFRMFLCCSLVRPIIILMLLILLLLFFGVDCSAFTKALFMLGIPYTIILASLNDNDKIDFICFIKDSLGYSLTYVPMFILMVMVLKEDSEIFKFVLFSLFLLGLNDYVIMATSKNKQDIYYKIFPIFFAIATFTIIDGFKFQKAILKVFGGVQDSSQSGWYLVKDRDILDFFTAKGYLVKDSKNIDDRKNYYINGYLLFNIGNLIVICPNNFEITDNQKLDFSRCLSLTSEDIKFMGRDFPKNNKNIAMMVAKKVMQIEQLDSKKHE